MDSQTNQLPFPVKETRCIKSNCSKVLWNHRRIPVVKASSCKQILSFASNFQMLFSDTAIQYLLNGCIRKKTKVLGNVPCALPCLLTRQAGTYKYCVCGLPHKPLAALSRPKIKSVVFCVFEHFVNCKIAHFGSIVTLYCLYVFQFGAKTVPTSPGWAND